MQQTFLSAYRSLLGGSTPREPMAWLATIARNECWSRARARMREPLAEPDHEGTESAVSPDALSEAIAGHELKTLCRALRRLPRQQREALLLRELSGYTYTEVAELLGVSESAVDSLLVRARRRLKDVCLGLAAWLPLPASVRSLLARLLEGGSGPMLAKTTAAAAIAVAVTGAAGGSKATPRVAPSHHDAVATARMESAKPTVRRAHAVRPRPTMSARRPQLPTTLHRPVRVIAPTAAPPASTLQKTPRHEPASQPPDASPASVPSDPAPAPEASGVPAAVASDDPAPPPADNAAEAEPAPAPPPVTSVAEALVAATEAVEETTAVVDAVVPVDVPSVSVPPRPKVSTPSLPKPLR